MLRFKTVLNVHWQQHITNKDLYNKLLKLFWKHQVKEIAFFWPLFQECGWTSIQSSALDSQARKEETWKVQLHLYRCAEARCPTSGIGFSDSHGGLKAMDPLQFENTTRHTPSGGGGGTRMSRGYQASPKIHVIRVVFQDQALYARTSFRGAKMCKSGKKGVFFGHIDKFWKEHDRQIKKNACKNTYLGSIFIPEKYVIRVHFVSPWTSLILPLAIRVAPPGHTQADPMSK